MGWCKIVKNVYTIEIMMVPVPPFCVSARRQYARGVLALNKFLVLRHSNWLQQSC